MDRGESRGEGGEYNRFGRLRRGGGGGGRERGKRDTDKSLTDLIR